MELVSPTSYMHARILARIAETAAAAQRYARIAAAIRWISILLTGLSAAASSSLFAASSPALIAISLALNVCSLMCRAAEERWQASAKVVRYRHAHARYEQALYSLLRSAPGSDVDEVAKELAQIDQDDLSV